MKNAQLSFNDALPCCYVCGQSVSGRWETLSKGLCVSLVKFYRTSVAHDSANLHLVKNCNFKVSEVTNFQKLQYFGLVAQTAHWAGYWHLTPKGIEFLCRNYRVSKKVFVFKNEVKEQSVETVNITEVMRSEPYWLEKSDFVKEMAAVEL